MKELDPSVAKQIYRSMLIHNSRIEIVNNKLIISTIDGCFELSELGWQPIVVLK